MTGALSCAGKGQTQAVDTKLSKISLYGVELRFKKMRGANQEKHIQRKSTQSMQTV